MYFNEVALLQTSLQHKLPETEFWKQKSANYIVGTNLEEQ